MDNEAKHALDGAKDQGVDLRDAIDDLAHDITNALTGIEACTRLALEQPQTAEDPIELLKEIQTASRKGLKLARRLSHLGEADTEDPQRPPAAERQGVA
jgi:signal transduction histidine kinase